MKHCISTMVKTLKLKTEVEKTADAIFEYFLPENHSDYILPKNRRKRLAEKTFKYPKNRLKFLNTLKEKYGEELTSEKLIKICEKMSLKLENLNSSKRAQATLLLYSGICSEPKLTISEIPIKVSKILIIAYVSMLYAYSDTKPVLVGDVLEWAYVGTIPYFNGYKALELQPEFNSLFKPLGLPSAN